nr:MAG TPA: hypothetical protein [Caudoviricetes sp.]
MTREHLIKRLEGIQSLFLFRILYICYYENKFKRRF